MVLDEAYSIFVAYLSCYIFLGSLKIAPFYAMLKSFHGHSFLRHVIIPLFLVEIGGETITIEVDFDFVSIDYNLLLGHRYKSVVP